jgi:hypothetical protein
MSVLVPLSFPFSALSFPFSPGFASRSYLLSILFFRSSFVRPCLLYICFCFVAVLWLWSIFEMRLWVVAAGAFIARPPIPCLARGSSACACVGAPPLPPPPSLPPATMAAEGAGMDMQAALQLLVGGGHAPAAGEQAELAALEQVARDNAKRQRELQRTGRRWWVGGSLWVCHMGGGEGVL